MDPPRLDAGVPTRDAEDMAGRGRVERVRAAASAGWTSGGSNMSAQHDGMGGGGTSAAAEAIDRSADAIRDGDWRTGLRLSLDAMRTDPQSVEAAFNAGLAFARLGRFDEAVKTLRVAARIDPSDCSAALALGNALIDSGRPAEAVRELRRATSGGPDSAEAHIRLSVALDRAGRPAQAAEALRRYLARGEVGRSLTEIGRAHV